MESAISIDTYEATRARQLNLPDKVQWNAEYAFRDSPYRHLHHQQGLIGHVEVKLLEAADLRRSYWSALALGPVKHLGLSKAHGKVSSFVEMKLKSNSPKSMTGEGHEDEEEDNKKALPIQARSPVVPSNDNPIWHNCDYKMELKKGSMKDGSRILLELQCFEDSTATENLVSGMPLVMPSFEDRLLGSGEVDVTGLMLGEEDGQSHAGVLDVWIPISKTQRNGHVSDTGKVRCIVSYKPYGMEPRENDLVAFEAFSRRSHSTSSCQPILPPLGPMKVLQMRGSNLLVEYTMKNGMKAAMKLHRNAVFVIERTNLVDGAMNLALTPADAIMSTEWGQHTSRAVTPILEAAGDLIMPAILSARIIFGAVRTAGMAGLTGIQAATHAVVAHSHHEHQNRQQRYEHRRV